MNPVTKLIKIMAIKGYVIATNKPIKATLVEGVNPGKVRKV